MFKAWKYEGFEYDSSINAYICNKTGFAHTLKYMAANNIHLKKGKKNDKNRSIKKA